MTKSFECALLSEDVVQAFRDAGFKDKTYPEDEAVYLRKDFTCNQINYLMENIVDYEIACKDDLCAIELTPSGALQYVILDDSSSDAGIFYYDEPDDIQDWRTLARDAGVKLSCK